MKTKKRFRYYFRQGWHIVNVDRANVWNHENASSDDWGNLAQFNFINAWCKKTFPDDAWVSRVSGPNGNKEYAFKEQKHANWFRLKWL
jgi:hypothetical protein